MFVSKDFLACSSKSCKQNIVILINVIITLLNKSSMKSSTVSNRLSIFILTVYAKFTCEQRIGHTVSTHMLGGITVCCSVYMKSQYGTLWIVHSYCVHVTVRQLTRKL